MGCTLEDILIFFTGADTVPAVGFGKTPKLSFLDNVPSRLLPTASTCAIELRIPTCHTDYASFRQYMELALKGYCGFGGV